MILSVTFSKPVSNIQDFFETIQKKYGKEVIFKFLSSGESIIGCTIYKTQEDDMHQYLCSMITTVAQTILRLKSFAEKEKRIVVKTIRISKEYYFEICGLSVIPKM